MHRNRIVVLILLCLLLSISCGMPHTHTFSKTWSYDEAYHWHETTCGHDVKADYNEHAWSNYLPVQPTHLEDGSIKYVCRICYLEKIEAIPALADDHTFSSRWSYDETYHWHGATCGHDAVAEKSEHILNEYGSCQICDYRTGDIIEGNYKITPEGALTTIDKDLAIGDIIIPSEVKGVIVSSIGANAFYQSYSLKSVIIPNTVSLISDHAFDFCTSLCYAPIPNSVTAIGERAFACTKLDSLEFPNSLTSLGNAAFAACCITEVVIPSTVTTASGAPFMGCKSLKQVSISNTLTTMPGFRDCSQLTTVNIPTSATVINGSTFMGCEMLTDIIIPNSITSIGMYAFESTKIRELRIPSSVTYIHKEALIGDSYLKDIIFDGTKTQWANLNPNGILLPSSCIVHCTDGDIN